MTDGTIYFAVTLTITEQKVAFELYNSVSSTSIKIVVTEKKYSFVHLSLFLFQIIINPFGLLKSCLKHISRVTLCLLGYDEFF